MTDPALEKKFAPLSFGDIAYLEAGSADRPPLLLVHGIPTSSFLWRHVIRFLRNDFHCYAPDLMGLGDTDVDPASNEGVKPEATDEPPADAPAPDDDPPGEFALVDGLLHGAPRLA